MRATVTLKEGRTYRYKDYIFTQQPLQVTDAGDIAHLKTLGVLNVKVEEDAPAPALAKPGKPGQKATPPAPPAEEPAAEEEAAAEEPPAVGDGNDDGETPEPPAPAAPAPKPGKPGPKPGQKK